MVAIKNKQLEKELGLDDNDDDSEEDEEEEEESDEESEEEEDSSEEEDNNDKNESLKHQDMKLKIHDALSQLRKVEKQNLLGDDDRYGFT